MFVESLVEFGGIGWNWVMCSLMLFSGHFVETWGNRKA